MTADIVIILLLIIFPVVLHINLRNKINEQTKLRQTHRHRERPDWWLPEEMGVGGLGERWEGVRGWARRVKG